jgi:creatinine amidohydrolase
MMKLEELSSFELRRLVGSGVESAVVPLGSIEGHGGHLPLGSDALLADFIGETVAKRLDAVLARTVRVGLRWRTWSGQERSRCHPKPCARLRFASLKA